MYTTYDSIIIDVRREYYINPSSDDNEAICNADTNYVMTAKLDGDEVYATAYYPELNVSVIFTENN